MLTLLSSHFFRRTHIVHRKSQSAPLNLFTVDALGALAIIAFVHASCLCRPSAAVAAEPSRPNIVLIMADDVGYECFGAYGSKQYRTPHIDALAQQGVRFNHCYAQPLCTPSRVKLMTGVSNVRNYAAFSILKPGLKTIGQYFQESGYRTMIGGKWQLYGAEHYSPAFRAKGALPQQAGFDETCLWQVDKLGERYEGPLLSINGKNHQFPNSEYGPEVVNRHVLEFMERQTRADTGAAKPTLLRLLSDDPGPQPIREDAR